MRRLFAFLLLLLVAIGLGLLLRADNGYVLLSWGSWSVEMSLALFAIFLVVGLFLLFVIVRTLRAIMRLPRRLRGGMSGWRRRRARQGLTQGLIDLAEGRWQAAERGLGKWADYSETPLINYLAAARAAQLQGGHRRRDIYLKNAYEQTPSATLAVLLTQAELQLGHGQQEHALATLRRLQELSPGHRFGLRMLARAYQQVGDWYSLHEILPQLRRKHVFHEQEMNTIERDCFRRLLRQRGEEGNREAVEAVWAKMPRRLRRDADIQLARIRALLAVNAQSDAEHAIEDGLKRHWQSDMVVLYGTLSGGDPARRLKQAETWQKQHPNDPMLLLTLARLCIVNELWGKAHQYLDDSLALEPRPDSYEELGRLLEHLGEQQKAGVAYRQGLEMAVKHKAETPGAKMPIVPRPARAQD
ncbi:HemY protein [Natronospira proteinivora]|uniref:HemY protein n=1 Tax=Natronospira proteinivora TaxID=1807133 RepID=A0ABT1G9W8_9GAMM|nr:heme biosynthesis HemY N-terminal domain-containing protein [Natronospira proteinivora]MCP1728126.1 HemY protein [Natronospira proteinivora]